MERLQGLLPQLVQRRRANLATADTRLVAPRCLELFKEKSCISRVLHREHTHTRGFNFMHNMPPTHTHLTHITCSSEVYLTICSFWKGFPVCCSHFPSASVVCYQCGPLLPSGTLTPCSNHFPFRNACLFRLRCFGCMQLKTADQVHQARAHFPVSAGEAKLSWISKRPHRGILHGKITSGTCHQENVSLWLLLDTSPSGAVYLCFICERAPQCVHLRLGGVTKESNS